MVCSYSNMIGQTKEKCIKIYGLFLIRGAIDHLTLEHHRKIKSMGEDSRRNAQILSRYTINKPQG